MARQPYLRVIPSSRDLQINLGVAALDERPELTNSVARCLMAWPHVEAEAALVLGKLLRSEASPAAMAVFQSIRKSQSQRGVLEQAAKASLTDNVLDLFLAILSFHSSVENERNSLAHGHFGTVSTLPDAYIWMGTFDFIALRTLALESAEISQNDLSGLYVYRKDDIEKIFSDINDLGQIWRGFCQYLDFYYSGTEADKLFQVLASHTQINHRMNRSHHNKNKPSPAE